MSYTHIIWDWNGTLLDDVHISITAMNMVLSDYGLTQFPDKDYYRSIFCFPVRDYYERSGFDFTKIPFEKPATEFIVNYRRLSPQAELFVGAKRLIDRLSGEGKTQLILSASEKNALDAQIEPFGIREYLVDVLGIDNHYAESKAGIAQEWFSTHGVDPKKAVFVGDTTHDFEVAQEVGCTCILVACGHQSREVLERTGAPVADDLEQAVDMILSAER